MSNVRARNSWRFHVKHLGRTPHLSKHWLEEWFDDCEQILHKEAPHLAKAASNGPGHAESYVDYLLGRMPRT